MGTKATITSPEKNGENQASKIAGSATNVWNDFKRFLGDVRSEMRKVVTPSRKEVQATTTVVIVTVFVFGVFFAVVDAIFQFGLNRLLGRLGGF